MKNIYDARRSYIGTRNVENGLSNGSVSSLKTVLKVQELSELFEDEESATNESESLSTSESHIEVQFAGIIEEFHKKLKEDPEFTCCSCEKLLFERVLTGFIFTAEKFSSFTWMQLKDYFRERDPDVSTKKLYICRDCRQILNGRKNPAQCVLNGLYIEPITEELLTLVL